MIKTRGLAVWTLCVALLHGTSVGAQPTFSHRLTGVEYDFDNNGQADATTTITYGAGGRATSLTYTYTGDGAPDLFNTEDDDAAQEDSVIGYNGADLVTSISLVRQEMPSGTEQFDTVLTFTAGELTRVDFDSVVQSVASSSFTTFSYLGALLDEIEDRVSLTNALNFTQTYAYGPDDLPETASFDSAGIDAVTTFSWRPDGQIDDLFSTNTMGGSPLGTGSADYVYDGQGQLQSESWSFTGSLGSLFTEFPGENYRKTFSYDGQDLKVAEEVDIDDDGSVEAVRTYTWEAGPCVPVFVFAATGRPNFARMDGLPYVPGTGATWFENCGPVTVPEPGVALSGLVCCLGLLGLARRRVCSNNRVDLAAGFGPPLAKSGRGPTLL